MKVIQIKAKVPLVSEDQMEAEQTYDLGNIAKNKEWGWRKMGFELAEIWRITEFDKKLSVIETFDDEKILVQEPFDVLFARWEKMKEEEESSISTRTLRKEGEEMGEDPGEDEEDDD